MKKLILIFLSLASNVVKAGACYYVSGSMECLTAAENLLSEQRLKQEGFFDVAIVRQKWEEHLSGKRNWQHLLWNVLMFQAWLEEYE